MKIIEFKGQTLHLRDKEWSLMTKMVSHVVNVKTMTQEELEALNLLEKRLCVESGSLMPNCYTLTETGYMIFTAATSNGSEKDYNTEYQRLWLIAQQAQKDLRSCMEKAVEASTEWREYLEYPSWEVEPKLEYLVAGEDLSCVSSPFRFCVYDEYNDAEFEHCLFCGLSEQDDR